MLHNCWMTSLNRMEDLTHTHLHAIKHLRELRSLYESALGVKRTYHTICQHHGCCSCSGSDPKGRGGGGGGARGSTDAKMVVRNNGFCRQPEAPEIFLYAYSRANLFSLTLCVHTQNTPNFVEHSEMDEKQ